MKPNYTFSRAPQVNIPRSVFNLGHQIKTTIDVDYLYPIYAEEILPGDTFEFSHSLFGRLTTPLTPIMDRLYLDTFFFFVPTRLIDSNFKKLMGESPVGMPDNNVVVPKLNSGDGVAFNSIYDYFGIPPSVSNLDFTPYKMRAYTYIYNDWFRDANLIEPRPVFGSFDYPAAEGATETIESYALLKRSKRLDYFTGALPWPQRGPTSYLPLGIDAPVRTEAKVADSKIGTAGLYWTNNGNGGDYFGGTSNGFGILQGQTHTVAGQLHNSYIIGETVTHIKPRNLFADLTDATAITVNQLREAIAVQHLYEAFARGGSNRYIEILRSTFDVVSPDARLQRSEYLGGSSTEMNVTTVAQTSAGTADSPLGNLASFVTVNNRASFKKSFTEHGYIIGVANVRSDLSYSQGLHRSDSRTTRLDFYWPQLANLGEQAVFNKEIFAQGTAADDDVFGYQERWAEYRYHPNTITGTFRPSHPQSLDVWHLSQEFGSLPVLNQSFIEEAVPIDRVLAVTDEPAVMLWGQYFIKAARPMPLYSIPGLERM